MKEKRLMSNKTKSLIGLLSLSLFFAILVASLPLQAVSAQLDPTVLQSLVKTGFTNQYPLTVNGKTYTIKYSITGGTVPAIVPNPSLKAADIIINPGGKGGIMTVQIPRFLLDAKNTAGQDVPFRVTLDGHGLIWKEIQSTNTDRVLAIQFSNNNRLLEIIGTQIGSQ